MVLNTWTVALASQVRGLKSSNDLVFMVLHYHYLVFTVRTLNCVGTREEGCRNRTREAEVLPQQQGTQHAVLSIMKHYRENVLFCRNITHTGKSSYTSMCFTPTSQAAPLFHPTSMRAWDRNTEVLTITHAFIWRSRNAIFFPLEWVHCAYFRGTALHWHSSGETSWS